MADPEGNSFDHLDISDNKKSALKQLEAAHGIITTGAHNAGIARSTFYLWLEDDPIFKTAVEDIQEAAIDFVESKLFEKINGVVVRKGTDGETGQDITYDLAPSDTAIIFYLKTKAKKRGYIERHEIANPPDEKFEVTLNIK